MDQQKTKPLNNYWMIVTYQNCALSFFFKAKGLSKQQTAGLKIHNIIWPKKLNWTLPSKFAKKKKKTLKKLI